MNLLLSACVVNEANFRTSCLAPEVLCKVTCMYVFYLDSRGVVPGGAGGATHGFWQIS